MLDRLSPLVEDVDATMDVYLLACDNNGSGPFEIAVFRKICSNSFNRRNYGTDGSHGQQIGDIETVVIKYRKLHEIENSSMRY